MYNMYVTYHRESVGLDGEGRDVVTIERKRKLFRVMMRQKVRNTTTDRPMCSCVDRIGCDEIDLRFKDPWKGEATWRKMIVSALDSQTWNNHKVS